MLLLLFPPQIVMEVNTLFSTRKLLETVFYSSRRVEHSVMYCVFLSLCNYDTHDHTYAERWEEGERQVNAAISPYWKLQLTWWLIHSGSVLESPKSVCVCVYLLECPLSINTATALFPVHPVRHGTYLGKCALCERTHTHTGYLVKGWFNQRIFLLI